MNTFRDPLPSPPVIVGVTLGQSESVLHGAAGFAQDLQADLVCAWVDTGRYLVEEQVDGSVTSLPFDSDLPELGEEEFDPELASHIQKVLGSGPLRWTARALAGDPARALAHLANTLNARLIVVGSKETGMRAGIQEFFTGSVAVHLAHRQHRPVLIIPVAPVKHEGDLPWERG